MESSDVESATSNPVESIWTRMNAKIASLESSKKDLNKELSDLEKRLNKIVDYLTGSRERRQKARKVVFISVAVAITSLTCGMNSNFIGISKSALPLSILLGVGSVASSLYYLKDVWFTFTDFSNSSLLRDMYMIPGVIASSIPETREDEEMLGNEMFSLNMTLPEDTISAISLQNRCELRTTKKRAWSFS